MVKLRCLNENSARNTHMVEIGALDLYFSYETVVAFRFKGKRIVCENVWGTTTGKHLNWIDGGDKDAKKARLPKDEFDARLNEVLKETGLAK